MRDGKIKIFLLAGFTLWVIWSFGWLLGRELLPRWAEFPVVISGLVVWIIGIVCIMGD